MSLVWITNILTTKIDKDFYDKYILITVDKSLMETIKVNDTIFYKMTPRTYVRLGKVISVKDKKIVVMKMDNLGNHSKSKIHIFGTLSK